jgi:hypothetical protein
MTLPPETILSTGAEKMGVQHVTLYPVGLMHSGVQGLQQEHRSSKDFGHLCRC